MKKFSISTPIIEVYNSILAYSKTLLKIDLVTDCGFLVKYFLNECTDTNVIDRFINLNNEGGVLNESIIVFYTLENH